MKYWLLAVALPLAMAGSAAAQTSAPSSNPSAHSQPSTSPNEGRSMSTEGNVKPCPNQASGTSDRQGGSGKTAASDNQTNNPGGSETSGGC